MSIRQLEPIDAQNPPKVQKLNFILTLLRNKATLIAVCLKNNFHKIKAESNLLPHLHIQEYIIKCYNVLADLQKAESQNWLFIDSYFIPTIEFAALKSFSHNTSS